MAVSCDGSVIKTILYILNAVWIACGAAIIYLGVHVLQKYNGDISDVIKETPSLSAIVLITAGGLIVLVSFLGCLGAIRESHCLLNTYGCLIFVCLAAQGVGAYLAIKYHYDLEKYAVDGIHTALEEYDWNKSDIDPANRAINKFQKQLNCCGGKSSMDWDHIVKRGQIPGLYPSSCCDKKSDLISNRCPTTKAYGKGCVDVILEFLKLYIGCLGYIAIGIALVELLGLIFACCLVRDIRHRYSSYVAPKARS